MKIPPTRLLSAAVLLLTFVTGFWLGWQANSFIAQDACLDRGGAWNPDARGCDTKGTGAKDPRETL